MKKSNNKKKMKNLKLAISSNDNFFSLFLYVSRSFQTRQKKNTVKKSSYLFDEKNIILS